MRAPNRLAPMPGFRAYRALAAAACALFLAACGGEEGTIPQDPGEKLLAQLQAIDEAVNNGQCEAAVATAVEFAETVNNLPEDVDPEVREGLVDASLNLRTLTDDPEQCREPDAGTTDASAPVPETTSETETEPTTTETTTEEEEPPPADDGQGNGPPPETPGAGTPGAGSDDGGSSGGIGSEG